MDTARRGSGSGVAAKRQLITNSIRARTVGREHAMDGASARSRCGSRRRFPGLRGRARAWKCPVSPANGRLSGALSFSPSLPGPGPGLVEEFCRFPFSVDAVG